MNRVLIIGSGGREHALGWKLAQSNYVSLVYYAPGNAGTEKEEKGRNISINGAKKENFSALFDFVEKERIDMVVVGPEDPLNDGIVNYFNSGGYYRIIGPTQRAVLLESDKFFSFDLMNELNIGQADSVKCYSLEEAIKAINERATEKGIVIKARGLTGGKGVSVYDSKEQALAIISEHIDKYGPENLVAERLFGEEVSILGISDGGIVSPLEISIQDHKRLLDGDKGLNTGGMGAYCPTLFASPQEVRDLAEKIMTPIVQRMKNMGREYQGFIYAGMILTEDGPKVLEFNVRFGDPECQPAMMMLKSDLYEVLSSSLEGKLDQVKMEFNPGASCCVVLASRGYPDSKSEEYKKSQGLVIEGLEDAERIVGVKVFHAGTKRDGEKILTAGGRVLGVTGYSAKWIFDAQKTAYEAVPKIKIPGGFHYRSDIADKALNNFIK